MCDKVLLPNGTFELTNYTLSYRSVDVQLKGDGSFYINHGSLITCRDDIHMNNSHILHHQDDIVHRIISIVCLTVSLIGLSCTISIHLLIPNLRKSIPAQLLMNYSIALLMAQLLFLLGGIVQLWPLVCTIFALIQHFFWLASFIWTSVMCVDMYCAFNRIQNTYTIGRVRLSSYYAVGWLLPAVFVATCGILDRYTNLKSGYGSNDTCWITGTRALILIFFTPLGAVILLNIVLVCRTLTTITRTLTMTEAMKIVHSGRVKLGIYLRLISMTGLPWVFGLIANITDINFMVYPFIVFNGSQGIVVCVLFCTSHKVREEVCNAWNHYFRQ